MELQLKERGCEHNLQGACPVSCDDGGHSYVAQMVGRSGPNRQRGDPVGSSMLKELSGEWTVTTRSTLLELA